MGTAGKVDPARYKPTLPPQGFTLVLGLEERWDSSVPFTISLTCVEIAVAKHAITVQIACRPPATLPTVVLGADLLL
jgi:hypothetical protein